MSLISAAGLAKSFGPVDIFSQATLSIPHGGRAALVGPNGVGKSTLLRILMRLDEPTAGSVQQAKGIKIGYLPQEGGLEGTQTVWEMCLEALADLRVMEAELARLEAQMSDPAQSAQALVQYGPLQERFERRGGYTYEARIRQTLRGLGFDPDDDHRPIPQLSGGQRTRALLARLLLAGPDLLVLDEPTNHLDIAAVEWLEGYLRQWDGAALIVSHDRYFLDQVANVVLEMSATGIETYRGNYSTYLQQRQERWEQRRQVFEAEKEKLVKDLEYIKKNISGQNTLQAKGRLRRLSRMLDAIDRAGLLAIQGKQWAEIAAETGATAQMMTVDEAERRVHGLHMPSHRPPELHLKLKSGLRSGDLVLRTYGLAVGYADEGRPLFNCPDLTLKRGECAALIGPNGAGKTTFLKTLLEKLPPLQGEVQLGASLKVAYFAQAHEDLHPERTLAQEIDAVAPQMLLGEIRNYLAKFLFTGEDVFKKVEVLSGGERGRLALAKLALSDANLLLLDEPTNHLDIPSQEILQSVLADYPGTVLLVSHDRYLIDALGTQIWEIVPGEAQLRLYAGDYSQYKEELLRQETAAAASRGAVRQEAAQQRAQAAPAAQPLERKRRQRLQELEKLISAHETELAELGRRLENPPPEPGRVQSLGRDYVRLEKELEQLMAEWVGLSQ